MSAFLNVYVTPKAAKDAVEGLTLGEQGPELKVRVRAVPDEGKANKAVCATVAKWLGVPKSAVSVAGGHTSRHKHLELCGVSQEQVDAVLSMVE